MGRKKKVEVLGEKNPLELRPEQVVKYMQENGKLPDDFNPYGDYVPETIRFLGERPPANTQFYVGINEDDSDLTPIYVSTPTPPPFSLIDNYNLEPDLQMWKRKEVPPRLRKLEDRALKSLFEIQERNRQDTIQGYKLYMAFWRLLEEEQEDFQEEIKWIKNAWWWRINGYWFFNDGVPVYCTGEYFDYLNFWYIKDSETWVEFREEDRKISIFSHYLRTTTESFAKISPDTGRAIPNEDGTYDMIDIGSRVFFGDMKPKFRRCGETQWACHGIWLGASTTPASYGTIISMDGDNAEKHYYKKLVPSWNKYPMFLKPIWVGSKRPTTIYLQEPSTVYHIEGLGSSIDYTESGGVLKNDGDTLDFCLSDEEGKSKTPITERWSVNKIAMSTGGGTNIRPNAYAWHPSTVEEIGEGAPEYLKMWELSCFYERIPITGQTHTGLARIFIPAYKKLEGYIDRWGHSVIDNPTERQIRCSPRAKFALTNRGAKETLHAVLDSLTAKGTPEAMEAYRSRRRKFPMKAEDCWLGAAGNIGFNLEVIDKRLGEINRLRSLSKPPYLIGEFYREDPGNAHSKVLWRNTVEGRWEMSIKLPDKLTNQMTRTNYFDPIKGQWMPSWAPVHGERFTCGADPFRAIKKAEAKDIGKLIGSSSNSRQSDGGICVYWEYDHKIDGGKPRVDWDSDRVVCVYRSRPPTQEAYFEDLIMTIQYFGAMCYPEINVERVVSYLIERGYSSFFLYDIDILSGKLKPMPGRYTSTDTWSDAFSLIKDHVEFRGHAECHDKLLNEIKSVRGPESMTHLDLLASFCMAKFGSKSRHREIISGTNAPQSIDVSKIGIFKKRRF